MQEKPAASNALAQSPSLANANFSIILNADRVTVRRPASATLASERSPSGINVTRDQKSRLSVSKGLHPMRQEYSS